MHLAWRQNEDFYSYFDTHKCVALMNYMNSSPIMNFFVVSLSTIKSLFLGIHLIAVFYDIPMLKLIMFYLHLRKLSLHCLFWSSNLLFHSKKENEMVQISSERAFQALVEELKNLWRMLSWLLNVSTEHWQPSVYTPAYRIYALGYRMT